MLLTFFLQSSLAINPASLVPGARPVRQHHQDISPSLAAKTSSAKVDDNQLEQGFDNFDDPPQTQTLHSIVKVCFRFLCNLYFFVILVEGLLFRNGWNLYETELRGFKRTSLSLSHVANFQYSSIVELEIY